MILLPVLHLSCRLVDKPRGYRFHQLPKDGVERRTIKGWCELIGVKIIDPDGFDRTNPDLWVMFYTVEEFNKGLNLSSVEYKG